VVNKLIPLFNELAEVMAKPLWITRPHGFAKALDEWAERALGIEQASPPGERVSRRFVVTDYMRQQILEIHLDTLVDDQAMPDTLHDAFTFRL
jgi:hypothetical protein